MSNQLQIKQDVRSYILNEFLPGEEFKTLRGGYSSIYPAMFDAMRDCCVENEIELDYQPGVRLRSIWQGGASRISWWCCREANQSADRSRR